MAAVTRLGLHGGPRGLYGNFSGKAASAVQMSGSTGFAWTPTGALDVEATLAGNTGWNTAPTGSLDVAATLAGSTGYNWGVSGNPVNIAAITSTQPSGGWDLLKVFDRHIQRKHDEDDERRQVLEEIEQIISPVDLEIAKLLQQDQKAEAREKQLSDLEQLVARNFRNKDLPAIKEFNENVAKALVRASVQGNYSALEAFEREMERALEEDEFLFMALAVLD